MPLSLIHILPSHWNATLAPTKRRAPRSKESSFLLITDSSPFDRGALRFVGANVAFQWLGML